MVVKPHRMAWNESFGKADHAGTVAPRFTDQPACFLDGSFPIEENRRCLHRGHAHDLV
jgi:hypothetical protein